MAEFLEGPEQTKNSLRYIWQLVFFGGDLNTASDFLDEYFDHNPFMRLVIGDEN
jgi:hypothetical protein